MHRPTLVVLALGLAVAASAAGCGGQEHQLPASNGLPAQGDQLGTDRPRPQPCDPPPASGDPLPAVYPAQLALPDRAVVTAVRQRGELAVLEGYVPNETIEGLLRVFEGRIQTGGFTVESEDYEGFEGEYFFRSPAVAGFVRVTDGGCVPDTARFALTLQSTG